MDLYQFTLTVVSATSIIISVTLIAVFITGYGIMKRLNRIFDRLDTISQTGVETSSIVKGFAEKTTDQMSKAVQALITVKGAQELVHAVSEALKKRGQSGKESQDGSGKE